MRPMAAQYGQTFGHETTVDIAVNDEPGLKPGFHTTVHRVQSLIGLLIG